MSNDPIPPAHIREVRRDSAALLALALVTELVNALRRKGLLSNQEGMDVVVEALQNVDGGLLAELQADRAGVPADDVADAVRALLFRAAGLHN
ncbi:hypothetical protein M0638_26775 [Roseomonas sp. NAR14]|uniref:Uncharacterized protein n=1 Tax=Roseomonas acroporae TaxID=2937791 RepID=A0A9X2BZF9_9PROT|nr:hypothetical protein [Roseomonas acroporae]MCK8787964.1 hypothetical protein [Roseomonas acroporae]